MTSIGTYWRTVRHLKARQIIGRVVFRLGAPVPSVSPVPERRAPRHDWVLPARRGQSLFPGARFRFLNEERCLDEVGWDHPGIAKLWRYNLHYFEDLNASGADERRELQVAVVRRWIAENSPAAGSGWEPYPTSLRVVNWIKWSMRGAPPDAEWLASLARQVRWLSRRLEWHLLGNHLFANAKALVIAGLYFHGKEADEWLRKGGAILKDQLEEQVLPDGGHFERSPMYHRLAWEDVLDLLTCIRCFGEPNAPLGELRESLQRCGSRMWHWAERMRFSGGDMPRFNDSAEGIAPPFEELCRVAVALGMEAPSTADGPVEHLASSGYLRLCWDGALGFIDAAPIGPDYLPGHAHADTLSFELEVSGRQVVVNRGTSCYGTSARRSYERSTAAHSTVEVCNTSSSETWGGFRVGRRAYPRDIRLDGNVIGCSHDGYRYLPGAPVHRRTWTMLPGALEVKDTVDCGTPAVAYFHLSPGLHADALTPEMWLIHEGGREVARVQILAGVGRLSRSEHAAAFGRLVTAETLTVELLEGRAVTRWSWERP